MTAEASIYSTSIDSSNFGNADGAVTKDMSLNLDQPIWRGGQTFAQVDRANSLIKAGEATLKNAEQEISLTAVTAYLNTLRDRELLRLRRKNETLLIKELNAARERRAIGDITNTDVQQAEARVARATAQHANARTNYEISLAEFEEVTGMRPHKILLTPYPNFSFPESLQEMFALAEKQNPEILMAMFQHQAAEHNTDATFRELFPQISAFAGVNKQYDPQPGIVDDTRSETIGIRATIALYQGGATRSRVREAKYAQKRREYEIDEIKRRIRQEVTSNWRSYVSAKVQTKSRKEEIKAAEFALKGVKVEATEGQRTVLDILDADQDLIDAQAALINAQGNETLAQYALATSLGGI